jgi:hypothetical protein
VHGLEFSYQFACLQDQFFLFFSGSGETETVPGFDVIVQDVHKLHLQAAFILLSFLQAFHQLGGFCKMPDDPLLTLQQFLIGF